MIHTKNCVLLFMCYGYVLCEFLDLREGKKCMWKGINGTCANVFKCQKAKYDLMNKEYPPVCAYDGEVPIVCCTNCYIFDNRDLRDEVFNPNLGTIRKTGSVAGDKFNEYLDKLDYPCKLHRKASISFRLDEERNCYFSTESSSGFSAKEIPYPRQGDILHTVVLGYGEELESVRWLCGGSIISENYILTSANCSSSPDLSPVRHVVTGKLNNTRLPEPWRRYGIKRFIPHPLYQPHSKYHDIALIETDTPIAFGLQVVPISLTATNSFWFFAIAWKELGNEKGLLETLDSVSVASLKSYDETMCSLLYPPQPVLAEGYNHSTQACYGYKGSKLEVCEGDKGAPIQTKDSTVCYFELLGINTLGRTCGDGGGSALYTRVKFYIPWIESIVWPKPAASRKRDANKIINDID